MIMEPYFVAEKNRRKILDMLAIEAAHRESIKHLSINAMNAKNAAWDLIKEGHPEAQNKPGKILNFNSETFEVTTVDV